MTTGACRLSLAPKFTVLRGLTHGDNISKLRHIIPLLSVPFVDKLRFISCARVCPLLQFQHVTTNSKTRRQCEVCSPRSRCLGRPLTEV
mgnify:FL=1